MITSMTTDGQTLYGDRSSRFEVLWATVIQTSRRPREEITVCAVGVNLDPRVRSKS